MTIGKATPFWVLGVGVVLSLLAWRAMQAYVERDADDEFGSLTRQATEAIERQVTQHENLLRAARGLFGTSLPGRADFRRFAESVRLPQRYPGVQALQFERFVLREDKDAFERSVRGDRSVQREGYPDFAIRPSGDRPDYYVIEYIEPMEPSIAAMGLDGARDAPRRFVLEGARDTGTAVGLGPIHLVQDVGSQAGFVLRLPVYRYGADVSTVEARRAAFIGFVGVVLRVDDFLRAVLVPRYHGRMDVRVHDAGIADRGSHPPGSGELLFKSEPRPETVLAWKMSRSTTIPVGGRVWRIDFEARDHFVSGFDRALPTLALLVNLAITFLVFRLVVEMARRRDSAIEIAESMTRSLRESEKRLELALSGADLGMWDWDIRTGRVVRNDRWAEICGYGPGEIDADLNGWERMVHPRDFAEAKRRLEQHAAGLTPAFEAEYRLQTRQGNWVWVDDRGKVVERDAEGRATRIAGTVQDITGRKQNEERLRASEERLALALEGSRLWLWDCNLQTWEVFLSDGWSVLMGGPARPTTTTVPELAKAVHPDDVTRLREALFDTLKGKREIYSMEHRVRTPAGEWLWLLSRGRVAARDKSGRATRMIGTNMDISDRKRAEERAQHMAYHDALTELPNRLLFENHVRRDIALAQRGSGHAAVLFLDLDNFKRVNDSQGHAAGDRLLTVIASRVKGCLRAGDTVARLGGDEFAVSLPTVVNAGEAAVVAKKILDAVRQPAEVDGQVIEIGASVGICLFPDDGRDSASLLRNADTAMYHAKSLGRGQFQYFREEMNIRVQQRLALERGLRLALERNEFVLHFQPQIDLRTGRIIGAEALVRWQHPERGLVPPGEFIPVAEETGQIVPLGEWVLGKACETARGWDTAGFPDLRVAVNLSVRQFREPGIVAAVRQAIERSGLEAARLELEITEGLLLNHDDETLTILEDLAIILGTQLTVDDFGTGYSSLSYLRRFPISRLKIDQAFVKELATSREDVAIASGVIAIAAGLELEVTAEGVETEGQLHKLREINCHFAQGYYFAKPLPEASFIDLLYSRKASNLAEWAA
jgi:diguanylate cyclase (GGDEF)-like protein/PAS domain S-box-containing protein